MGIDGQSEEKEHLLDLIECLSHISIRDITNLIGGISSSSVTNAQGSMNIPKQIDDSTTEGGGSMEKA